MARSFIVLPPEFQDARIWSFECTFCVACADRVLGWGLRGGRNTRQRQEEPHVVETHVLYAVHFSTAVGYFALHAL